MKRMTGGAAVLAGLQLLTDSIHAFTLSTTPRLLQRPSNRLRSASDSIMSRTLAGDYMIQVTDEEWQLYEIGSDAMEDLYSTNTPINLMGALTLMHCKESLIQISLTPSSPIVCSDLLDILARCLVQTLPNFKNQALQLFDDSDPIVINNLHSLFPSHTDDEYIELVNQHGDALASVPRSLAHQHNLLHRGIGVIVYDGHNDSCYVHQRTPTKRIFPSLYDMWCGGISLSNEIPFITAQREVQEELGLTGTNIIPLFQTTVCTEYNRCVVHVFSYPWTEGEKIQWQPEEVAWGAFCSMKDVELSAELCISRMMERKSWPGKTPWNWEERYHALCVIADNTKNMKPWTAWDYVPDGLLVWEAWLEWRNNNLEAYARLIGDRS